MESRLTAKCYTMNTQPVRFLAAQGLIAIMAAQTKEWAKGRTPR